MCGCLLNCAVKCPRTSTKNGMRLILGRIERCVSRARMHARILHILFVFLFHFVPFRSVWLNKIIFCFYRAISNISLSDSLILLNLCTWHYEFEHLCRSVCDRQPCAHTHSHMHQSSANIFLSISCTNNIVYDKRVLRSESITLTLYMNLNMTKK